VIFATKRETLKTKIEECYAGSLDYGYSSFLMKIVSRLLSRVTISDDYVEKIADLTRRGTVVYALKNKSRLNGLILQNLASRMDGLPRPVYYHGVGMRFWQPVSRAVRCILASFFYNPYRDGYLERVTREGKSAIIYVHNSEFVGSRYPKDPLHHVIAAAVDAERPVYLVPILISYGRRRVKKDKGVIDVLFGESDNPGAIRRMGTFFRFSNEAFVIVSDPLDLTDYVKGRADDPVDDVAFTVRETMIERINAEKRAIVGPILKSREEIIGMVLREAEVVAMMDRMSRDEGREYRDVIGTAKKYLYEIAANYTDSYIGMFNIGLTWLWNNIYDGVVIDHAGLNRLREISKRMPFVVVPCHRSHIDYLLLSYVFYHNNIAMPFVAAGINMAFWPLGGIFRKSGAFFLRRTFHGNKLYALIFAKYIKVLLDEGWPIEFFIEGGRSRTGKMVMPKFGLLSMVMQAYDEGVCDNLAIMPVYIGYDRVIEEKSYRQELSGTAKKKENARSLLKSGNILRKRYGRVYLNVGEPIFLKSHLASRDSHYDTMQIEERQRLYRKTSYEIADRINKVSIVTPFSLVATGLLCHYRRGISHDDLFAVLDDLHHYLVRREVKFSETFARRDAAFAEALARFESTGLIERMGFDEDEDEEIGEIIYSVDEDKRLTMEYYKNTIIHFFLPIAFVSASIVSAREDRVSVARVMEDYHFLKRLFRHEFIFDDSVDDADEVNDVLAYIHDRGMVSGHDGDGQPWIEVRGIGRRKLSIFVGLIANYIEAYWIVLRGCPFLKKTKRQERDFVKKLQKLGTKMYRKGEISKMEALSQMNYKSAIRYLADTGIIETSYVTKDDRKKKADKMLFLTADKERLEHLRRNLFKYIV